MQAQIKGKAMGPKIKTALAPFNQKVKTHNHIPHRPYCLWHYNTYTKLTTAPSWKVTLSSKFHTDSCIPEVMFFWPHPSLTTVLHSGLRHSRWWAFMSSGLSHFADGQLTVKKTWILSNITIKNLNLAHLKCGSMGTPIYEGHSMSLCQRICCFLAVVVVVGDENFGVGGGGTFVTWYWHNL